MVSYYFSCFILIIVVFEVGENLKVNGGFLVRGNKAARGIGN